MSSTSTTQAADTGTWIHGCFIVRVGTDYKTFKDIVTATQADELYGTSSKPALEPVTKKILNQAGTTNGPLPAYFSSQKCRDTSLGGNDAINPLPQFSVDDDIGHPHYGVAYGSSPGMGQVYSENYDDTQQIIYLGFGIPVFSNLGSFWSTAVDLDLANFANKGSGITAEKIGYMFGSAPIQILSIATIPFKYLAAMVDGLEKVQITKYYAFSSQMPMYFRFVNTILAMLATNMNMMGSSTDVPTTSSTGTTTAIAIENEGTKPTTDMSGASSVFKDFGLDMARIMTKRYLYEHGTNTSVSKRNTDKALFDAASLNNGDGVTSDQTTPATTSTSSAANTTNSSSPSTSTSDPDATYWKMSWFDCFTAAYKDTLYDGHLFIGFRIDKGMACSESFSNQTGESQVSQKANESFQAGRDANFATMGGNFGNGTLGSVLGGVVDAAKGLLSGLTGQLGLDPLAAAMSGSARIDIPEVWMSSGFSRSASFSISCLAPYGDLETIFQSEYVPLACMLAGALPRSTGYSSHSAPFVCQAYCRGVFSSPLCIIESLDVQRGADQFGFTAARLPLKITMHVTLKDLSPVMHMHMAGDAGIASTLLGHDDAFGEYMLTLSGMGLRDRLSPYKNFRRKVEILWSTAYKNKLSPFMLGMEGGSRFMISRVISLIVSGGKAQGISNN